MNEIESVIRSARQAQVDRIYKSFANAEQVAQDEDGITKARVPGETKVKDGKTFVWTEYAPGKFDWQLDKNSKKKPLNKQSAETVKQNVKEFVKKNSANLYEYFAHGAENVDADDAKKFAILEKMGWSAGKFFDSADKTAAERYVRKMKQRGYEVHEVEGISDYAYLLKKADEDELNLFESMFLKGEEITEIAEENPFDAMYKSEEAEIEKARSGVYKDTAENRKKGRVGQQYGQKKADDSQLKGKAVASLCDGVMAYYDEEDDAPSEGSLKKQFKLAAEKLGAKGLAEQMFNYWTKNNPASPAQSGFSDDEVKEAIESAFDEFGVKIDKETKKFLTPDEEDEDDAEKAETGDLEKSDIMNAFGYGSDVKVTKTGKEIAEQVDTVILPALNAKLIEKKSDADDLLAECGNAPTKEVPVWWTGDVKIPVEYKMYDWDETCVPSNDDGGIASSLSASDAEEKRAKYNRPENADQANARRQYNDCVRCVCEILVDIKACEILKSLKPGKEYELSTRQVVALQF